MNMQRDLVLGVTRLREQEKSSSIDPSMLRMSVRRSLQVGLVPVVRAASADEAFAAIEAIRAGGIPSWITLAVPGAVQMINELTKRLGDEALIGTGQGKGATITEKRGDTLRRSPRRARSGQRSLNVLIHR